MSIFLIKTLTSVFYIGYSKFVPGTLASLVGFLVYVFFIKGNTALHLGLTILVTIIGFGLSARAEAIFNKKDARQIVIDDFYGMWVSLLFLPYSFKLSLAGFILFRIMDGLKPYPIYKVEKINGSLGVMGDDLLAGIFVNITLQILLKLISLNF
ncbi:MAG: phosphatidylglycerophosphatase A [Candidatus Omnitrophota bacterium]